MNGQGLHIAYISSLIFNPPHKPNVSLYLTNLLHVPSITKNLLSVTEFAKDIV